MITEDRAVQLFAPIQSDLKREIFEAWSKIHSTDLIFKSRSRASLMWDQTFYHLKIAWCDSKYILRIEEKTSQTAHYWLDSNTFFRIKKGNEYGFTRNYPTQTAIQFHDPQRLIFDSVDKLEVTYVLNHEETEIVDIAVVHRIGNEIVFKFSILESADIKQLPIVPRTTPKQSGSVAKLKTHLSDSNDQAAGNE